MQENLDYQYIEGLLHLLVFFIHLKKIHGPKYKIFLRRFPHLKLYVLNCTAY
jgi:hypothetical protein